MVTGPRKLYAERPGWGRDFDYDEGRHLAAYQYAIELVRGKRVLDAGCGEGFCTRRLAEAAAEVVGVDYSAEAIETSRRSWSAPNLSFRVEDLSRPPAGDERYDVILNFQVLEHIEDEHAFLAGLRDRLAPGGVLMLTTPNVLQSFSENPCHLREYSPDELRRLLESVFGSVELLGMFGNAKVVEFDAGRRRAVERILRLDPLGLRRLLPERLLHVAFARLGQLVRRRARKTSGAPQIGPDDFYVSPENIDGALDLVALCRA
jgi:SAM-dependent methyltransferase